MRIVGGEFGGTPLSAPKGRTTRPTGERTREALFSILASQADFSLARARVLDLFAGTGALGLEALSRGGDFCLFVENDTRVRGTLRDNCDACGVLGRTTIYRRDATRLGPRVSSAGPVFNLVFADPPYGKKLADAALDALAAGDWLAHDAMLVVEEDRRAGFEAPAGFTETQRRSYGDTELVFLKFAGA
ncbi:MAG: 16S rRNA (guanine(966)-N(2))-methyltransferase RsmD [Pseudomonadota bacterium]|nr:16S rRNA (guanine(966)-N(2))-methyltransferase RsmD [Pseudomonadota bacterium]